VISTAKQLKSPFGRLSPAGIFILWLPGRNWKLQSRVGSFAWLLDGYGKSYSVESSIRSNLRR
jgi:hypothetical protein